MSSVYTDRKQIETIFGKNNVERWADLDNTGDERTVEATIDSAIVRAGMHLNGRLHEGPYEVPFEEPIPEVIAYLAALKAGTLLYDGRSVVSADDPNQVTRQDEEYEEIINRIRARTFKIHELTAASTDYIKVYNDD